MSKGLSGIALSLPSGKKFRRRASSLIVTLLVLVVLSTIVVAFMQSMSVERNVAKSYLNRFRAEQAALSGLDVAKTLIAGGVGTNFGYATINTNILAGLAPVLMIVSGQDQARVMPLVSGNLSLLPPSGASNSTQLASYLADVTNTNSSLAANVNKKVGGFRLITDETGAPRFNGPWVYITDASGKTNSRFSFVVTDEQGKLNLAVHGSSTNTNRAGWDQVSEKIPVTISGNNNFISSSQTQKDLSNYSYLSLATLGQAFSNRSDYESKKQLYSLNTFSSTAFIPAGRLSSNGVFLAYPDAHKPKYDLNALATNTVFGVTATRRAQNIAAIIDTNLSWFKTRDVAFVADGKAGNQIRYIERLAASIIDYIDQDTVSTLLADGEPAGKELAPVITSIAERYNWVSEAGSGSAWTNTITHTTFVQLWNPYQTNVTGVFGFELFTPLDGGRFRYIQMPGAVQEPMATVDGTNLVTLRANEYKVFETGIATNIVISSVQGSLLVANRPIIGATANDVTKPLATRFRAKWQNMLVDYTPNDSIFFDGGGSGLRKRSVGGDISTRINLNGISRFSINYPSYGSVDAVKGYRAVGDPRQNYLANYVWDGLEQTNNDVRWNGRNNNTSGVTRQDYATTWLRRDFVRADPRVGTFTGDSDPTTAPVVWEGTDASNSIAFIRNAPMKSVGELGNIYDPVHLSDVGFATDGGGPSSWYASGGGRTLRVGQPEFAYPDTNASTPGTERKAPAWTNEDLRATSLLDLFTVLPTNSSGLPETLGKININTAHRDVLAAVFSTLGQDGDMAFTNSRITTNAAYQISDAIISFRPYYKLSDIYKFTPNILAATNFSPILGASATNVAAVMDAGREQVLGALLETLDVRSQVFQITVLGEALDTSGRVVSQTAIKALVGVLIKRNSPTDPLHVSIRQIYVQLY